jgi:hypothetical protein
MKQPFRFFRGEFNGFFLYHLVTFLNHAVTDIIDELIYQIVFQWKTEEEVKKGELPIRDEDIVGVGKIAGVFQAFGEFNTNIGSVYFTNSHIVNGQERSDRGLVDIDREVFKYVRVEADDYPDDIVNEATVKKRISVVPPGTEPVGYVAADTPLFNIDGTIIWDNILPEPPEGIAFNPFFGEKFLVLEEEFILETTLTAGILKLLIECLQQVRYQGPSVALFLEVTKILGEGYIYDVEIIPMYTHITPSIVRIGSGGLIGRFKIGEMMPGRDIPYYDVQYKLDPTTVIDNQLRRLAVWRTVCQQKFKLYNLVNITPD